VTSCIVDSAAIYIMVVKFINTICPPPPQLSLHTRAALSSNSNETRSVYNRKDPKLWDVYGLFSVVAKMSLSHYRLWKMRLHLSCSNPTFTNFFFFNGRFYCTVFVEFLVPSHHPYLLCVIRRCIHSWGFFLLNQIPLMRTPNPGCNPGLTPPAFVL
jgi:hypothetical protein